VRELPEHEERRVREYAESQLRDPDDPVMLVQRVGVRRVAGRMHELYDVRTAKERWWVISDPMNLYSQDHFHSVDMAFTYHLGVTMILAERYRTKLADERREFIAGAWRRFERAVDAFNDADEAEAFQAVGVMCREALLALVREQAGEEWLPEGAETPQLANFKAWAGLIAEGVSEGRLRSYLKAISTKTWALVVWLQHHAEASPRDADLVLDATGHVLGAFSQAIIRSREGTPERCPSCGSYRIGGDGEPAVEGAVEGWRSWRICGGCGWQSAHSFEAWG